MTAFFPLLCLYPFNTTGLSVAQSKGIVSGDSIFLLLFLYLVNVTGLSIAQSRGILSAFLLPSLGLHQFHITVVPTSNFYTVFLFLFFLSPSSPFLLLLLLSFVVVVVAFVTCKNVKKHF